MQCEKFEFYLRNIFLSLSLSIHRLSLYFSIDPYLTLSFYLSKIPFVLLLHHRSLLWISRIFRTILSSALLCMSDCKYRVFIKYCGVSLNVFSIYIFIFSRSYSNLFHFSKLTYGGRQIIFEH